jgi:hypothetical protein
MHTCAVHTVGRLIGQAVTPTTCPGFLPPGETVDASLSRLLPLPPCPLTMHVAR